MKLRVLILLLLSTPFTAVAQSLSGLKFCIDPGHGGNNPANDRHVIPDPGIDFWESESNFQKALLLKPLLEAKGGTVILTRNTNSYPNDDEPSLSARVQTANANNVNWFHSIHSNAFNQSVNYTLMLVREKRGDNSSATGPGQGVPETQGAWDVSLIMAPSIQSHLRTTSSQTRLDWTFYGGVNGGFSLGVLRGLNMPGELSEGSFHDFYPETRRLMNNDYRKMEANALLKSWMQYFSVPADGVGIVAGLQLDNITGGPKNQTVVRLLPENRLYTGDSFNNGFYMFDSLAPGSYELVFETPRYDKDTVDITITGGSVLFVDRTLTYASFPFVTGTTLSPSDTSVLVQSPITVRFSTAMDSALVRQALSFSPPASGALSWTADLKNLSFSPSPSLDYLTRYSLIIDSSARSANGYSMDIDGDGFDGDSYSLNFRTEPPLSAQPVAFGQVKKDDTSSVKLTIHNRASYGVVVNSISTSTPEFWTSSSAPDTVQGNDSLLLDVFFKPASFGSFADVLVVSPDSGTIRIPLSGNSPAPNLLTSHSFIGFGTVPLNSSKIWPIFYMRTTSVNGVRIDSVYTKTPAFRFSPLSYPVLIQLDDTVNGTITFFPQVLGAQWDTLLIANSSLNSPAKVTLTGNGSAPVGVGNVADVVHRFDLLQNFPNPFNPSTRIDFQIAETS
ncbi:MAG: N-acetylmuramoyl-L-alanine amidase, partial [Ignavibacteriales bacterium]|nr:N-acetylmuramoyl-L-alanine amidase [Ignavibacteriales bacterium]